MEDGDDECQRAGSAKHGRHDFPDWVLCGEPAWWADTQGEGHGGQNMELLLHIVGD